MFYKKKKKKKKKKNVLKKKKKKKISLSALRLLICYGVTQNVVYTHTRNLYYYIFIYLLINYYFISYDKKTQLFNTIH